MNKETMNQIIKTMGHLTQTIEYQALGIFSSLNYKSSRYYYIDQDTTGIEKIRSLDLFALTTIDIKPSKTILKYKIKFIGDVKNHPHHNKKFILLGLKPLTLDQSGLLNSLYFWKNLSVDTDQLLFPNCLDLIIFDENGRVDKKKDKQSSYDKLRNYCEQIVNGYQSEVNRSTKKPQGLAPSKDFVLIPILVFGNEVEFIAGGPEGIKLGNYIESSALMYHFQSVQPFTRFLTPILITSLQNLSEIVNQIEKELSNQYKNFHAAIDEVFGINQ